MITRYMALVGAILTFLSLSSAGLAEQAEPVEQAQEVGEVDLYDPSVYLDVPVPQQAEGVPEEAPQVAPEAVAQVAASLRLGVGEQLTLDGAALLGAPGAAVSYSSDDPNVAAVEGQTGLVTALNVGTALLTVAADSGAAALVAVTVLPAPGVLSFPVNELKLAKDSHATLKASVPEGTASWWIGYASSDPKVAAVDEAGNVTAGKTGAAVITATAYNGASASCAVTVYKVPSRVRLSASGMTLEVGQLAQLTAKLPSDTYAELTWQSDDPTVATVDGTGLITALRAGQTAVRVVTSNGKSAQCRVKVCNPGEASASELGEEGLTPKQMLANLSASRCLGEKRNAVISAMKALVDAGFEPAFVAGVGANICAEGSYGVFESSEYARNVRRRPRYFCYLDGGEYYSGTDGRAPTAVYLPEEDLEAYEGEAEARPCYGELDYYRDSYSGKFVWEVSLGELEAFLEALAEGEWEGKFGLGIAQWTGAHTQKLVTLYRKRAGEADTVTPAQAVAAENEMLVGDFKGGYSALYDAWREANAGQLNTAEAARSAAEMVCTGYEVPVNKSSKAAQRGNKAAEMYRIMAGEQL